MEGFPEFKLGDFVYTLHQGVLHKVRIDSMELSMSNKHGGSNIETRICAYRVAYRSKPGEMYGYMKVLENDLFKSMSDLFHHLEENMVN